MGIAQRIEDTVESWRVKWGDALKTFLTNVLSFGLDVFFGVIAKSASPKLKPMLDMLVESGKLPEEVRPIIDELLNPEGEYAAVLAQGAGSAIVGGALSKIIDAIFLPTAYWINEKLTPVILNPDQYLALFLRGRITGDVLRERLNKLGFSEVEILRMMELTQARLDPASVITAWRRDPAQYEHFFDDLRHTGWSEDRINALKLVTQSFPSLSDVITFYAHEAFESDMISKYGLLDELPPYEGTLFEKLGVPKDMADLYWISHWVHASWTQVVEMLHRGLITDEDVYEFYRVVEIPPYWRDKLTAISWNVPTRVDVRRWWDMRTITEERLREVYKAQGYHDKDLDDYVLWTKVYTEFPSLIARFQKGWITEDDVRSQLISLGMPAERVEVMMQEKVAPELPSQVEEERKATATEIMKGVKLGYITEGQGVEMLGDLGYSSETALFKLTVYGAIASGSPESYIEFKRLTQLYRGALKLGSDIPSTELLEAGKAVKQAKADLAEAEASGLKGKALAPYLEAVTSTEYRYRQLLIAWEESKKKRLAQPK